MDGGRATHGTYAGYQQCKKTQDGPCANCKQANAAYQRQRRAQGGPSVAKAKANQTTRNKALRILGNRHYLELVDIIFDLENVGV